MAYTPTIGEITGGRVDPELAKGQPAVVLDISQGLKYANDAAHAKAQMDWEKYKLFQKNLTENIKNINLDYTGVRPGDSNELRDAAAQFYAKLAENPAVLGNPAKYAKQYGELQNTLQGLQTKIAKSKQLEAYATAQEMFREKHPNLINDKNNKILDEWRKTPLDQASTFQWDLPKTIDLGKLSETAVKQASTPNAPVIRRISDPVTGAYTGTLERVEGGTTADPQKYFAIGKDILNSNLKIDEYGHTPRQAIEDNYSLLPESAKKYFENTAKENKSTPLEEYFKQSWESYFTPRGGKEISTQFKDEAFIEGGKLNHDLILEKARAKDARALEAMKESIKLEFENKRDKEKADALIKFGAATLQDAIKNGKRETSTEDFKEHITLNLPPLILEKFATPGKKTTKESGIETTTSTEPYKLPDEVDYLPDSKQYRIIHYKKKDGEYEYYDGHKVIDQDLSKKINEDAFLSSVSEAIYPKAESPQAYSYAKDILKGKSLADISTEDIPSRDNEKAKPAVKSVTIKKEIRSSDIPSKAAAAGYTEEEYKALLKENGVKIVQ